VVCPMEPTGAPTAALLLLKVTTSRSPTPLRDDAKRTKVFELYCAKPLRLFTLVPSLSMRRVPCFMRVRRKPAAINSTESAPF
jgi:hypothetical protein